MKETRSTHRAHYDMNRLHPDKNRSWRVGEAEYDYLRELLDGGFPEGSAKASFVGRLEQAFADKFDSKYGNQLHQRHGHIARGASCGRRR